MNIFIIKGLSPKCLGDIVEKYKIVQALSSEYLKRCRKHINMKLISFKKKADILQFNVIGEISSGKIHYLVKLGWLVATLW